MEEDEEKLAVRKQVRTAFEENEMMLRLSDDCLLVCLYTQFLLPSFFTFFSPLIPSFKSLNSSFMLCNTLSYLILSCLISTYLISSCLILSYLVLSYLILSYLILSYLVLHIIHHRGDIDNIFIIVIVVFNSNILECILQVILYSVFCIQERRRC